MKAFLGYIRQYSSQANGWVHGIAVSLLALLVFANYHYGINSWLFSHPYPVQFMGWYVLLLGSLAMPYLLFRYFTPGALSCQSQFILLLFAAPLIFAWKMTAQVHPFSGIPDARFWNQVVYFPIKVLGVCGSLYLLHIAAGRDENLMGLRAPRTNMGPYWGMLALMVPLVLLAGTQQDFQQVYPKLQHATRLQEAATWYEVLLFELAYGSDFFTIELFFRGFLVIYFARWVGYHAILPMAVLYCVIHFGKPLGECISSFFGGMLLGIVSFRTQSIWGGLVVHLGIAWLMELVGAYPLIP